MKQRIALFCIAVAAMLAVVNAGQAQDTRKPFATKGVLELGGTMAFSTTWNVSGGVASTNPVYTLDLNPQIGYFVIDGLELGANPLGVTYVSQGSSNYTLLKLLGSVAYNFKTPAHIFPYVEGLAGWSMVLQTGGNRGGFTWAGRAGLKVPVGSGALVNVGAEYLQATLNLSGESSRSGYNRLAVVAGFAIWL